MNILIIAICAAAGFVGFYFLALKKLLNKPNSDGPVTITVINNSTVVSTPDFVKAVAAVQKQLSNEFKNAWGKTVTLVASANPAPGSWLCYVRDVTDRAGALGYHNQGGTPTAFVFAKDAGAVFNGVAGLWTVCLSHELMEMVVDPQLNTTAGNGGQFEEICDPVEQHYYAIDDVLVTDFVYPSFYKTTGQAPYDPMGLVQKPLSWIV